MIPSIERLLKDIAPDYYTTSEYKTGIENFINEAEHNHRDLKDYCIEALSNNYLGVTQYRKVVICYLLQEPNEDLDSICKYYRFIELMLYLASKATKGRADFLKVIPREGAEEVLDCMFNGNPPRDLFKLVERICPSLPKNSGGGNKVKHFADYVRGGNEDCLNLTTEMRNLFPDGLRGLARWIFRQVIRTDGKGLRDVPSTPAIQEILTYAGKTPVDNQRKEARKLVSDFNERKRDVSNPYK